MQVKGLYGKAPVAFKSLKPREDPGSKQKTTIKSISNTRDIFDWSKPSQISVEMIAQSPKIQTTKIQTTKIQKTKIQTTKIQGSTESSRSPQPLQDGSQSWWSDNERLCREMREMRQELVRLNHRVEPRLGRYEIGQSTGHKLTSAEINSATEEQIQRQLQVNKAVLASQHDQIHQVKLMMSNLDSKDYLAELMEAIEVVQQSIRLFKVDKEHLSTDLHRLDTMQPQDYSQIKSLKQDISVLKKKQKELAHKEQTAQSQLQRLTVLHSDSHTTYLSKQQMYQMHHIDLKIAYDQLEKKRNQIKSNCELQFKSKKTTIEQLKKEINLFRKELLEINFKINELKQKESNTEFEIESILPRISLSPDRRLKARKKTQIIEVGERYVEVKQNHGRNRQSKPNRNWRSVSIDAS